MAEVRPDMVGRATVRPDMATDLVSIMVAEGNRIKSNVGCASQPVSSVGGVRLCGGLRGCAEVRRTRSMQPRMRKRGARSRCAARCVRDGRTGYIAGMRVPVGA
eukprot:353425-Chlamydomonas_euryale.AAC.5